MDKVAKWTDPELSVRHRKRKHWAVLSTQSTHGEGGLPVPVYSLERKKGEAAQFDGAHSSLLHLSDLEPSPTCWSPHLPGPPVLGPLVVCSLLQRLTRCISPAHTR